MGPPHAYIPAILFGEPMPEEQIDKANWLERAQETYRFHRSKLVSHDKWTAIKTAKALRRSIGSISEDLMIARWCKTHDLEKFEHAYEAIEFIRKRKRELEIEE